MLEGKCSKCGTYRYGWALLSPRHQTCPTCGVGLEITKDGHELFKGFSPFTAERLDVNLSPDSPPHIQKRKGKGGQKGQPHP